MTTTTPTPLAELLASCYCHGTGWLPEWDTDTGEYEGSRPCTCQARPLED